MVDDPRCAGLRSRPFHDDYVCVEVLVAPWPWTLLNVLFGAVIVVAIVVAWRSADRVVAQNRAWTRAWRILVACIAPIGINGVWFRIGALFILVKYGRTMRLDTESSGSAARTS
jgi:hypothetical protein